MKVYPLFTVYIIIAVCLIASIIGGIIGVINSPEKASDHTEDLDSNNTSSEAVNIWLSSDYFSFANTTPEIVLTELRANYADNITSAALHNDGLLISATAEQRREIYHAAVDQTNNTLHKMMGQGYIKEFSRNNSENTLELACESGSEEYLHDTLHSLLESYVWEIIFGNDSVPDTHPQTVTLSVKEVTTKQELSTISIQAGGLVNGN